MNAGFSHTIGPLARMAFAQMSVATDDPNVIHIDHLAATTLGLPGVVGSGAFVLGIVESALRQTYGVGSLRSYDIAMSGPVLPDHSLTVTFTPGEGRDENRPAGEETLAFTIHSGEDHTIATGTAIARVAAGKRGPSANFDERNGQQDV